MKENKSEWRVWLQYSKEDLDSAIAYQREEIDNILAEYYHAAKK